MQKKRTILQSLWKSFRNQGEVLGPFFLGLFAFIIITNPFSFVVLMKDTGLRTNAFTNLNDDFVDEVVNFCTPFEDSDQAQCVVSQVSHYYNYTDRNATLFPLVDIKTPSEFKVGGGLCRDIASTYAPIFKRLGWQYYFRFLPEHVYITVYTDELYCNIDGHLMDCV